MTTPIPQKRVLPARERRGSVAKRRQSSPVVQTSPAPASAPITPSEAPRQKRKYTKRATLVRPTEYTPDASTPAPGDEGLPTKLTSRPLPVTREKQSETLSRDEYQSIADSAILAASLYRSRTQWLCEGIFKRYWVKPVKRKGVIEQPSGNPDVKSMQKLGNATITIEPHSFDATFYTVRDPTVILPPYQRHPNQHTVKQMPSSYPQVGMQPPQHRPTQPAAAAAAAPLPGAATSQSVQTPCATPVKQEHEANGPILTKLTPTPSVSQPARPPGSAPAKPSDDPVIQMLAARAARDQRLKDLMKVVAMSQATPDQLREFQGHIDEFNAIVKAREAVKVNADSKKTFATPVTATPATNAPSPAPPGVHQRAPPPSVGGPAHLPPQQPYMAYYPPPPRPEPIIKHIIVEFHSPVSGTQGPTTDRWLFPEHAVLEMRAGGMEMVASFFVERSGQDILASLGPTEAGDEALRQKYQANQEYFQPVTVTIKATQHRTIETIARAAKPLLEVQQHMKEVMEKKTRAPVEYLVYQLPRDKALADVVGTEFVDSGVDVSEDEDDELKDHYGI